MSIILQLFSCKKAGEEVIETVGKSTSKESIGTSVEIGTKTVIKLLTKNEIEYALIKNGLNKDVLYRKNGILYSFSTSYKMKKPAFLMNAGLDFSNLSICNHSNPTLKHFNFPTPNPIF